METKHQYLVMVRLDADPGDTRGHVAACCATRTLAEQEADWMQSDEGGWSLAWVEEIDFIAGEEDLTIHG